MSSEVNKEDLVAKIDSMIGSLSRSLSESDVKQGWAEEARMAVLTMFQDLKIKIVDDESIPDISISRGIDSWGVVDGDL